MLNWLDKLNGKTETETQQELELKPEHIKTQLDKVDGLSASMAQMQSGMSAVQEFIAEQRQAREEARQAEINARRPKIEPVTDDDWLTDPRKAFRDEIQPIVHANIINSSELLKQQLFEDKEFYHGDFKREVDSLINSLPMNQRADPNSILNCYDLAVGRHAKEIKENKLKSRFSGVSSASSGESTSSAEAKEVVLNEDEAKVAKIFGLSAEDYSKTRRELTYI